MALPHADERVIKGLLYLWVRDAGLDLTPKTARYIEDHLQAYLGDQELRFSSEEIDEFVSKFVPRVVHRLRQLRPVRMSRYQRNQRYRRPRVALDKL